MKILIYSANFAPENTGIGKYSGEMASWLAAQGHEVRVVVSPPYYPAWKIDEKYNAWPPFRREFWQGVDVWRTPLWVPRKPSGLKRILHLLTFAVSSLPVMLRQIFWRPDVVMTVAPFFLCAPAGWLTARMSGASSWLHIQDLEVDVAFQMGMIKGKRLYQFLLSAESWLLCRFDMVSSISDRMIDKLRYKGVAEDRLYRFPNWVDITHVHPSINSSLYRVELGIEASAKVVLYSGSLGSKQGLMMIPEAARKLTLRKDIVFVICGDGVMKSQLEAASLGLDNIRFLPLQPFERLGELLGMADMHLLPQSPEAADLVLPSKLSGMLASGRPVIATCSEDTEIAAVVSQCGIVVSPNDGLALTEAIVHLADDHSVREVLGKNARNYAEDNYEIDSVLGQLLHQFHAINLKQTYI